MGGQERILEFAAVLLLSVATVCIAWSGYQAAKWSGLQARHYAQASTARALANRSSTLGGQERIQDLLNFNRWLEVSTAGQPDLAQLYVRRFRPEFRPAFDAWIAAGPDQQHGGDRQSPAHASVQGRRPRRRPTRSRRWAINGSTRPRTPPSTPTPTSSGRSSSPRCCSSPASRCGSDGSRCASRCWRSPRSSSPTERSTSRPCRRSERRRQPPRLAMYFA